MENSIELELLRASYQEHFKYAKDLSMYLPINHPKRVKVEYELNKMAEEIKKLTEK